MAQDRKTAERRRLLAGAGAASVLLAGGAGALYAAWGWAYPGGLACHEVGPMLRSYAKGELPEEQSKQVAEHLESCPYCRSRLEEIG